MYVTLIFFIQLRFSTWIFIVLAASLLIGGAKCKIHSPTHVVGAGSFNHKKTKVKQVQCMDNVPHE